MARTKLSVSKFKRAAMQRKEQHSVKGGQKASPSGPGYQGSSIWDVIDVRENSLRRESRLHQTAYFL